MFGALQQSFWLPHMLDVTDTNYKRNYGKQIPPDIKQIIKRTTKICIVSDQEWNA